MKYYLFTLLIVGLISCNNKLDEKHRLDIPQNNPDSVEIFKAYYSNGIIKETARYVNNELHGVHRIYDSLGNLENETLLLNNIPILYAIYGDFTDSDTLHGVHGVSYYYPNYDTEDTAFWPAGTKSFTSYNKIVPIATTYFDYSARDTIDYGDTLNIRLQVYIGTVKNLGIRMVIGNLDNSLDFDPPGDTITFYSSSNTLNIKFADYNLGSNLLTGKSLYSEEWN
jgi:hypothetical protein